MNCWHCDRPAHGSCRFCGRALCRDHIQSLPYIVNIYQDGEGKHKAIVVDNVLFCGVCKPQDDPVVMKNL